MASWEVTDPNLELEGSSLGRGSGFYDQQERRRYDRVGNARIVDLFHFPVSGIPENYCLKVTMKYYQYKNT